MPPEFACICQCLHVWGGHVFVMQDSETPASPVIDFSVPQSWPHHTKLRDKCPVQARPQGQTNTEVKPENGFWLHVKG